MCDAARVMFHKNQNWLSSSSHEPHEVTGTVYQKGDDGTDCPRFRIEGKWSTELWAVVLDPHTGRPNGSRFLLWRRASSPPHAARQYEMTAFAFGLNTPPTTPGCGSLPPTDARFRPDSRALEDGSLHHCAMSYSAPQVMIAFDEGIVFGLC